MQVCEMAGEQQDWASSRLGGRRHCGRAASGLVFDFGVSVEIGAAVDDLDRSNPALRSSMWYSSMRIAPAIHPT